MQREKLLKVFDSLPTKRKQVLLGLLRGDTREKIMADIGVSADALTQHRRQLYKDFQIEIIQNEVDDPRSGERKLPQLIALFADLMPELISTSLRLKGSRQSSEYNEATWVERSGLTQALVPVLKQCRVLALTGITGIGKTDLAKRLVAEVSDRKLCRLNLDDGGITPDFATSGAALLRSLGEELTLEDQKDVKNLLTHLLKLLQTQSYLVQVDSLERLLKGNDREVWSEFHDACWRELFQQLLASGDCRSQLILTTQDLPGELEAIGSRYEPLWHCAAIQGLSEAEQLQLFEKRGIAIDATTIDYLKRIGRLYAGHPLVLRVIAEDLKACNSNVAGYWQRCNFAELEANRPIKFSRRALQLRVEQRVKESLERLPQDALQLLCRSTVYRRPVPERFWLSLLPERTEAHQQAALNLLKSRTFAEEDWTPNAWLGVDGSIPLSQHNLVRSVAYDLLKANIPTWHAAERQAAYLWLTVYKPAPNASNLETVRGYLEAFEHCCNIEDWEATQEIALTSLNTPTQDCLCWQLGVWGYFQEEVVFYSRQLALAKKVSNTQGIAQSLGCLGQAHHSLGQYERAIDSHQEYLALALAIGDRRGEGNALGSLGNVYYSLGQYEQALNYHQQALVISRKIHNRQSEGCDLGNLGNVYYRLGQYEQAIDNHKQRLTIARETDDLQSEGIALGNLGSVYHSLGQYEQALDFYQQYLTIARKIVYRQGEGIALVNIGETQLKLKQYSESLPNTEAALEIFQAISDRAGEACTLKSLAELHQVLGEVEVAQQYCQQALALATELGIPLAAECEALKLKIEEKRGIE